MGNESLGEKEQIPTVAERGQGMCGKLISDTFFQILELSQTFLWRVKPPIRLQIATSVGPTFNIDLKSNNRWLLDLIQKSR